MEAPANRPALPRRSYSGVKRRPGHSGAEGSARDSLSVLLERKVDRPLVQTRLQEVLRLLQIEIAGHGFKVRSCHMLLLADRLEEQHSSGDVNICKVCLPVR
jgi:hypothetical protein